MSDRPEAAGPEEPAGQRDALRSAVERTLAATAGSASEAGSRARELLDEVSRRGGAARDEVSRRGGAAREEVDRRRHAARERIVRGREEAVEDLGRRAEAAGSRIAATIADLRGSEKLDLAPLREGLASLERRLEELEATLKRQRGASAGSGGPDPDDQIGGSQPQDEGESGGDTRQEQAESDRDPSG